jgi:hypothetical protein
MLASWAKKMPVRLGAATRIQMRDQMLGDSVIHPAMLAMASGARRIQTR